MAIFTEENLRQISAIVRKEIRDSPIIASMQSMLKELKQQVAILQAMYEKLDKELKRQGALLQAMHEKFDKELKRQGSLLQNLYDKFDKEQQRQGVLLEDLNSKFDAVIEASVNGQKTKTKVSRHEDRIENLESDNKLTKSVLRLHSQQIEGLQGS